MTGMAFAAEDGAATYKAKGALPATALRAKARWAEVGGNLAECRSDRHRAHQGTAEGKKAPNGKPGAGLTADQASAVAAYVKALK